MCIVMKWSTKRSTSDPHFLPIYHLLCNVPCVRQKSPLLQVKSNVTFSFWQIWRQLWQKCIKSMYKSNKHIINKTKSSWKSLETWNKLSKTYKCSCGALPKVCVALNINICIGMLCRPHIMYLLYIKKLVYSLYNILVKLIHTFD